MNTPREMFIEGLIGFQYPGNYRKRIEKIDRLADQIGATIYYGLNTMSCGIEFRELTYQAEGLRGVERVLRWLKRHKT